jgi:hypothetical protein
MVGWLLPSVAVVVFVFVFWASLLFMPQMMNADGDLGRHITIGEVILETGEVPLDDRYSHTMAGGFVVPHEWLSQLAFAVVHRAAGLNGVAWLTALVLATTYGLLTGWLQAAGTRAFLAMGMGFLAALVGAIHHLTRPHLFTILFFTGFLLLLENYRRTRRWHWVGLMLPVMVVWANTHGAFISGLVLVGLYGIGAVLEKEWRLAAVFGGVLVALTLVSLINPVGVDLIRNSFAYLGEDYLVDVTVEYRSPNFHQVSVWPFAGLLLFSLALGWLRGRRLEWTRLLLLGTWTAFALYSGRNIPLYAIVAVLVLTPEFEGWLAAWWPMVDGFLERTDKMARLSWGWMWAAVVVGVLIAQEAGGAKLDVFGMGNRFNDKVFPVAAVDALLAEGLPEGEVFNEFTWGGYLLYRLWPEKRVWIDGQTDYYGEELTRQFLQVAEAKPGWEEVLVEYGVDWVIIPPDRPLAAWLAISEEWERVYEDETAVVWERRE